MTELSCSCLATESSSTRAAAAAAGAPPLIVAMPYRGCGGSRGQEGKAAGEKEKNQVKEGICYADERDCAMQAHGRHAVVLGQGKSVQRNASADHNAHHRGGLRLAAGHPRVPGRYA